MKSHFSFHTARRALVVTTLSLAVSAGVALAQTQGSSRSSTGSTGSTGSSSGTNSNYGANNSSSSTNNSGSASGSYNASASSHGTHDTAATSSSTGSMNSSGGKLGFMDKRFVTKAADGGQAEVQIAQLAAQQATNPEVKSFAQKLVNDHTAVNQELMSLASSKGVALDKDDGQDRFYKRLSKKTGADFDREFVEHMIDDHEKDIKMFEKASNDAKDSDIRSFASKHVGHLREHLTQAQGLRASVMPTGREDDTSGRANLNTNSTTTTSTDATNTDRPSTRDNTNSSSSGSGAYNSSSTGATGTTGAGTSGSNSSTSGNRK